jgi:hypothetical protein
LLHTELSDSESEAKTFSANRRDQRSNPRACCFAKIDIELDFLITDIDLDILIINV